MPAEKLLLHVCCGPCSIMTVKRLHDDGYDVTAWYMNPNIQPLAEYLRRREAAGECARAASTAYNGDVAACKEFALRRLRAVPEVPLFHVGGDGDWDIAIERGDGHVDVSIAGHARPLPLMGAVAAFMGMSDGEGVMLRVSLSSDTRASWVGGDYGAWQTMWGA